MRKLIKNLKDIDKDTYKIMKYGLKFCFIISIISAMILLTYHVTLLTPDLYYTGLLLFRLSCIFGIEFIICGIIVDNIKKQTI